MWTEWCDRDDPSGNYDYESLKDAIRDCPNICVNPVEAECRVVDTHMAYHETSDELREACTPTGGLICKNEDQDDNRCEDYEIRFMCPPDRDECMEKTDDCDQDKARCENTHGSFNCICNDGLVGDGRSCFEGAKCTLWGDPHYTTFDGEQYNFQGLCKYTMVKPCTVFASIPDFNVITKNRGISKPDLSIAKYALITVYGYTIELSKYKVTVNGKEVTPSPTYEYKPAHANWNGSYITIKCTTLGIEVITDFGLIVKALDRAQFDIFVPEALKENTCGLCGDYNGQTGDDFILPNGERADDPLKFADAWRTNDDDPECKEETVEPPECEPAATAIATEQCNVMKDQNKFADCLALIENELDPVVESCIFDGCQDPEYICSNFKKFETMCQEHDIAIVWRTAELCPLECGVNAHYEAEGPVCPPTCSDYNPSCSEKTNTAQGCQCDMNYVLSGNDCVQEEDCGCTLGNKYYKPGEQTMSVDCKSMCTCRDGEITCLEAAECHEDGKCVTSADGSSECKCGDGFNGSGTDCVNIDECDGSHGCDDNAACFDSHGSYNCRCNAGYTGDGFNCENADECTDGVDTCSPFAKCTDNTGSYACTCEEGYVSDASGKICYESVADEPEIPEECNPTQKEECMECADCKPLPEGHFTCVCPPGTVGDGKKGETNTGCSKPMCSVGWLRHDDGCYKVFDKPETFDDGEKECQAQGGHLASIVDEATVQFLQAEMKILGQDDQYWIGYTDKNMEGIFLWKDHSASDFQNWGTSDEPTKEGYRTLDCVSFGQATSYKFTTKKCNVEMGFVCRKPLQLKPCPRGWFHFDGSCYMSSSKPVSWTEAYLQCVAHGSDLTSISSEIENDLIKQRVIPIRQGADLWVGGNYVEDESMQMVLRWVDPSVETPPPFLLWAQNEPSPGKICVVANGEMIWRTEDCALPKGFICEKKINDQPQCPGMVRVFERCAYLTEPSPFAGKACANSGGRNFRVFAPLFQQTAEAVLNNQDEENAVRFGFKVDGVNRTFKPLNWGQDQPEINPEKTCVHMSKQTEYKWFAASCSEEVSTLCFLVTCEDSAKCTDDINSKCHMGQCQCNSGFKRNNNGDCEETLECTEGTPCRADQDCQERDGAGYDCTCKPTFLEFGDNCISAVSCVDDNDCNTRAQCKNSVCECNSGYEGDGKSSCHNVDECQQETNSCDENSECKDTDGSYTCDCKTGYVKDPSTEVCEVLPKHCEDIRVKFVNDPSGPAPSGSYEIDPDGPGKCSPLTVSCIMREDIGITVIPSDSQTSRPIRSTDTTPESVQRPVAYRKTDDQINCVIEASEFCYQNVLYECSGGAKLQDVSSITDNLEKTTIDKCACGMLGTCANPESECNCDGTPMGDQTDKFKFIDKNNLPIRSLQVSGVEAGQKAATAVGPLMCAQKQFDIPLNCDDAMKNYGVNKNGEVLVDLDGPDGDEDGNLPPFLVYCDVTSYPDTGVAVVDPIITRNDRTLVQYRYPITNAAIIKLVKTSEFCSQDMSYICKKSLITGPVSYSTIQNLNNPKAETSFRKWAGGNDRHTCGCGVTNTCANMLNNCNCDNRDDIERTDFGTIIDKKKLPVVRIQKRDNPSTSTAKTALGPLRCGPNQFGIPLTCQQYRELGYTESYTYLIDPDGPNGKGGRNVAPFPVFCQMDKDRLIGITIVGHDNEDEVTVDDSEDPGSYSKDITYIEATPDQLDALTEASSYCSQDMAISCINATLKNLDGSTNANAFWIDNNGEKRGYFAGAGDAGEVCQCGLEGNCESTEEMCNCDSNLGTLSNDNGVLTNKKHLPIKQLRFGDTGDDVEDMIKYKVGKLVCHALYETCHDIYQSYESQSGFREPTDGIYMIDPDGVFNEDPFTVDCLFPSITIVNLEKANYHKLEDAPENLGPNAQTVKPVYIDATIPQLEALTKVSGFCRQYMRFTCQHAPLTGSVQWASSDGQKQNGWAGSNGGDKCACGEVGKCEQGGDCNCDVDDNTERRDDGWLINKKLLPVTEISFGLSKETFPTDETKVAEYHLGALECSNEQFGIFEDCQGLRNSLTPNNEVRSNAEIIDPDQKGELEPFVVYCEMLQYPPIGITVIPAVVKNPLPIQVDEVVETSIIYTSGSPEQLTELTKVSEYCTQEMAYNCKQAVLDLSGDLGLYSRDGVNLLYWSGTEDSKDCDSENCNCDGSSDTVDDGGVRDKNVLPILSVKLGKTTGSRELDIGELRCSGLFKTCHEILLAGANLDPNWDGMYAIDSDGSGPLKPFAVKCDFLSEPGIGITEIVTKQPSEIPVTDSALKQPITYENDVSPEQAHQLAQVSGFCLQGMKYTCKSAALMKNGGGFLTFDGSKSKEFAGADNSDSEGCACVLLGTCPANENCRCDAAGPMETEEGDFVTNRDILPVTGVESNGLTNVGAEASFSVGNLRCGPKPFGLPKDCQEAMEFGYKTGEALIWPSDEVVPFNVFCDMDSYPGKGVTIVKTDVTEQSVTFGGEVPVVYVGPSIEQVTALVKESERCYLPMKFECTNTKFSDKFSIQTGSDNAVSFFGSARQNRMCNCGEQNRCGGEDGRSFMELRNCNCDVGDDKNRVDAGVFGNQGEMPVTSFKFEEQDDPTATGKLSLGSLYCVDKPIDLDECSIEFNDCHKNAECVNRNGYYQCVCNEGYRGKGRDDDAWANGRECYDDNECNLGQCPLPSGQCTNTEGSYDCTCTSGFEMNTENLPNSPDCIDVNECDPNANIKACFSPESCTNMEPGFTCKCPPGFTGNGFTCTELAKCTCNENVCTNFGEIEGSIIHPSCNHILYDQQQQSISVQFNYMNGALQGKLTIEGDEYGIDGSGQLTANGVKQFFPYTDSSISIFIMGGQIIMTLPSMTLIWNLNMKEISVFSTIESPENEGGLCGNQVGPKVCTPADSEISKWIDDSSCDCTTVPETPEADDQFCGDIDRIAENSLCLRGGDSTQLVDKYHKTCERNICLAIREIFMDCRERDDPSDQSEISKYFEEMAKHGCDIPCAEDGGMHFQFCGPECPETCGQKEDGCIAEVPVCVDGCYCNTGLILNNNKCTPEEECGCVMDGTYIHIGESFVNENCSEKCECVSSKADVTCSQLTCEAVTTCAVQNGVRDCHCNEGYSLKDDKCQDDDECVDPNICQENSKCDNIGGSYTCTCKEDYEMKDGVCEDIDECTKGTDNCDGDTSTCSNKEGGFDCNCKPGFSKNLETDECKDVDECASNRHDCDRPTTDCFNIPGSFTCNCKPGFARLDDKTCKGIDECTSAETPAECVPNSECEDTPGSYTCKCIVGYRKTDEGKCEDIPECDENPNCPAFSTCVELAGSHRCDCNNGYVKNEAELCEDVDECGNDDNNNCDDPNAKCLNTKGSYKCGCKTGFTGDGINSCIDDDECSDPLRCGSKSKCTNVDGSYNCKCEEGFESPTSNNMNCEDIEECVDDKDDCHDVAICENTVGSFKCTCNTGFNGNGKTCEDDNECDTQPCGDSATCKNTEGSYECECLSGYSKKNGDGDCINDHECNLNLDNCDPNANCEDTPGSYTCTCIAGYTGDGMEGDCTSIDECANDTLNTCTERQDCEEKPILYNCHCKEGYEPSGIDCVDILECSGENKCHKDADCSELEGSYSCECKDGYSGDGETCDDDNECDTLCKGPGQICENLPGTYRCTCVSGYEQQADLTCEDEDECTTKTATCSGNTKCNNTEGSFECVCLDGFGGEGGGCEDEDECTGPASPCRPSELCENTNGGYMCYCEEGRKLVDDECKDIDECTSGPVNCVANADCVNNPGSYECNCKKGFVEDVDGSCKDINECLEESRECSPNGKCVNSPGSYSCVDCKDGYKGDGKICDDVDECTENTDDCSAQASCDNNDGSYKCTCDDGYRGEGKICTDINECEENLYECTENSHCKNAIPIYTCECDEGFTKEGDICVEINECVPNPCDGGECFDLVNSFECTCEEDYRLHTDDVTCLAPDDCTYDPTICDEARKEVCKAVGSKKTCLCSKGYEMGADGCEDINECLAETSVLCPENMKCKNNEGAFDCVCREGYEENIAGVCEEIDECLSAICIEDSTCKDGIDTYTCECDDGYTKTGDDFFEFCQKDDECQLDEDCPANHACVNGEQNALTCKCKEGFDENCNDVDECATPGMCSPYAKCENTAGSYDCVCLPGFNGNGIKCTDIDECASEDSNNCGENTECENNDGGYLCLCLSGYNGHCDNCQDINECATGLADCSSHSECTNSAGSYACKCLTGFVDVDGKCENKNECDLGVQKCPVKSVCLDTWGSYVCTCLAGYQKSANNLCENENECLSGEPLCGDHATCYDTDGSFECQCDDGYDGDGQTCIELSPTACGDLTCHVTAICVTNSQCQCPPGYNGNPIEGEAGCSDVNECNDANACDPDAACENNDGSYTCQCNEGYNGDGRTCQEETPAGCLSNADCGFNSECKNDGSCDCYPGYAGQNGFNCQDIDECENDVNDELCGSNTYCYNKPGGHECVCRLGYDNLDTSTKPNTCSNVDECDRKRDDCRSDSCSDTDGSYTCICFVGVYNGFTCEQPDSGSCDPACADRQYCNDGVCTCQPGYSGEGCKAEDTCSKCHEKSSCAFNPNLGSACTCNEGYEGNGIFCQDINECATGEVTCGDNAHCVNTEGTAYCNCYTGYAKVDEVCKPDVSPSDPCGCGANGVCEDMATVTCLCDQGFVFKSEATSNRCRDINECNAGGYCHIYSKCTNSLGSYECACLPGYYGDGKNLCEKDGCTPNPCGLDATCQQAGSGLYVCLCPEGYNLIGGRDCVRAESDCSEVGGCGDNAHCVIDEYNDVSCECNAGFIWSQNVCIDRNECDIEQSVRHNCDSHATCFNFPGGHSCSCNTGYEGSGHFCKQIDECTAGTHDCSVFANCDDLLGSYMCECKEGYEGDGKTCTLKPGCTETNDCHVKASCQLTELGYKCRCNPGYYGDGLNCQKVDECADPVLNTCKSIFNVKCENLDLGFRCVCLTGFTKMADTDSVCEDIDECKQGDQCGDNSDCENTVGSYYCECKDGYTGSDGLNCQDINECSSPTQNECNVNADCENLGGSYSCKCKAGYSGNGISCEEINECNLLSSTCPVNSACVDGDNTYSCKCNPGFTQIDANTCQNINECALPSDNTCDVNGLCEDNDGSYTCTCNQGYRGNGRECTEYNPCDEAGACHKFASCTNNNGVASCACNPGYKGDGAMCEIVDECADNSHNCCENADCFNENPGFRCKCKPGYYGDGVTSCTDIDECDPTTTLGGFNECDGDSSTCENTDGGYNCPCIHGYIQFSLRDQCIRIDLCDEDDNNCHEKAKCEDVARKVVCTCNDGYVGDGVDCIDFNECTEKTHDCSPDSTCFNSEGGFTCKCNDAGYKYAVDKCIDIIECDVTPDICAAPAICANNVGSYKCVCPYGYIYNEETKKCQDIDECTLNPCPDTASCNNIDASYTCTCPVGDRLIGNKCVNKANCDLTCLENEECKDASCVCIPGYHTVAGVCADINECLDESTCDLSISTCENINGDYNCKCKAGFRGNYPACEDVIECAEGTPCGDNEVCENTVGSYDCNCRTGFSGTPCTSVNECENPNACPPNSDCKDTDFSYDCLCKTGYTKDSNGLLCIDVNECLTSNPCDTERGYCANNDGSYRCKCNDGFIMNGNVCRDFDECSVGDKCHFHAGCTNTAGSYTCVCNIGFTGNGRSCEEIDECDPKPCDDNANCQDELAGYTCICKKGYEKIGEECKDINECATPNICGENQYCKNIPKTFECLCNPGYEENGLGGCTPINPCLSNPCAPAPAGRCEPDGINPKCSCNAGYSGDNCEDIDECTGSTLCKRGKCENIPGSFYCVCPEGYELDNFVCDDINECTVPEASAYYANCGPREYCVNDMGTFSCECKLGYKTGVDGCEDIDECGVNRCDANADCYNILGSFRCDCKEGYSGTGLSCKDDNECDLYPGICGPIEASICTNEGGSYQCSCLPGYKLVDNKCQDINDCLVEGVCGQRGSCGNIDGSYICSCPEGYIYVNGDCQNIDECANDVAKCNPNADCNDLPGSYECECIEGYRGDGKTCTRICGVGICPTQSTCTVSGEQAVCECKCNGPRCTVPGEVCGSDAVTYTSESALIIAACEQSKIINKDYDGACEMTCDALVCPNHQSCIVSSETNRPTCVCHLCTEAEIDTGKLCTDKRRAFASLCDFKKWQCNRPFDESRVANYGSCPEESGCQLSDFGTWSPCSVTCGEGIKTKSRTIIMSDIDCPALLVQPAKCYEPACADSVCDVCPGVGEVCVVKDGKAECVCPDCTGLDRDLVCAQIGDNGPRTFINRCVLQRKACEAKKIFTELHPGRCGDANPSEPLSCSVVTHFGNVRDADGCVTSKPHSVNKCSGGCGKEAEDCCKPETARMKMAQVTCPNSQVKLINIPLITSCKCGEDSGVGAEEASTTYKGFKFIYN